MIKTKLKAHKSDGITWYSFDELDELKFFKHWITGRNGGVSKHPYESLNLGDHVGDDISNVKKNRDKLSLALASGKELSFLRQVHSNKVIKISAGYKLEEADGLIIDSSLPAGILTADCLPIIIADPKKLVVAILHAGRMGVFKNIVHSAITSMKDGCGSDPATLKAGLAPAIRECCYKVGEEVFSAPYEKFKNYFNDGKLNMTKAVEEQLLSEGLPESSIYDSSICTACNKESFFSYRKEGKTGRFMTGAIFVKQSC